MKTDKLSWYTCDLVSRWPASAVLSVRVCFKGERTSNAVGDSVLLSLRMGNAYVVGVGDTVTEAIWDLDRSFRTLVRGARFSADVLAAIEDHPPGPECGHSVCSQNFIDTGKTSCIDNYDGGDDGDAWSGGFAENH